VPQPAVADANAQGKGRGRGKGKGKGKGDATDPWATYDVDHIREVPGNHNVCIHWEHIDVQAVLKSCGLTAARQGR
jgi:hypothetical protein